MDYLAWNDAIGARFFNPDRSGARVFLYVTTDVVTEVGAPHDADLDDFIGAVKTGPPWNTRHGRSICQQALQAFDAWRGRNLEYPPYLAYLALFALADTIEVEGFSRSSYYPGLRQLLGEEPVSGWFPSFDKIYELWFDLEVWTNEDKNGELGIFGADILGSREYVGLPKAQTILTDDERHKLPLLFAEAGFDPSSPPSDTELAYLLSRETHHYLLPHTKHILNAREHTDNESGRNVLVGAILDELESWDGSAPPQAGLGEEARRSLGNLRLVMTLDLTARTAHFALRCRSHREYPEEGLELRDDGSLGSLYCFEDYQDWSTLLANDDSQTGILDASRLDWRNGLCLADEEHSWRVTLAGRSVRVLVKAPFGFDGFVEESQIPKGRKFYLLSHADNAEALVRWGSESCDGFRAEREVSGLPGSWNLYYVERANSDVLLRDAFPFLAFPTVLRIHLRGGLKVRGNQYFTFALPQVEVTGAVDDANVYCNDHQLNPDPETGLYTIPDALCARRLIVEVRRNGECVRSRSLYAVETVAWRDAVSTACLDKFGLRSGGEAAETCVGPIVDGATPPDFNPEVFLPPSAGHRVYFVGRNPGEIIECPSETIPDDWQPVWAIPMQRRGKGTAVYCGTDPANEAPGTTGCRDHRRRRLWQKVLWYRRKQIAYPSHPTLRALWRKYREMAHRVR